MNFVGIKFQKGRMIKSIVSVIFIIIFGFIAVAGGLLVGKLIIGKLDTFDPSQYTTSNYIESESNVALWSSKNINKLTPTQIFCVAERKILQNENYSVKTKGYNGEDKGVVVTLGMKQDLYGYRYRKDGKGYFDYFSTGIATVAKKVEYTFGEGKYYCYEGSVNGNTTTWKIRKQPESGNDFFTADEYKELTGCNAENPIDYIVSTKTIIKEQTNEKVGSTYSYTLNLDSKTSVLNYVKKMKYMSGFDYPKFVSIELRFEVDENMNFQNIYVNENYNVLGMGANSKYKMEFSYSDLEVR